MRIEQTRRERAHNIATNLKRLMDRRRLVNRAGDRLEILRIKREWIDVTIPADYIEWMMRHRHLGPARTILHQNFCFPLLIGRQNFRWPMQIPLRVGRPHLDLTLFVQITLWNPNRADRLENQVIFFFNLVRHDSVGNSARNHYVIFGAVALFSENGLERSATFEHKDDLVRPAISVVLEIAVGLFRWGSICDYVLVKQNRNPASIEITSARNVRCLEMMMPQG